jgi:hypothetical protein
VGRGGTFRYNNADHAIETGLLAARGILGEAVDVDSVNSASEYLEERRVPVAVRQAALATAAANGSAKGAAPEPRERAGR